MMEEKDSCTKRVGPFFCSYYIDVVDDDVFFIQSVRIRYKFFFH